MNGDVISPELALVDPVAAAEHSRLLPAVTVDSALRRRATVRATHPEADGALSVPVWFAVPAYVIVKVASAVLVAVALVGSAMLAATVLTG